jgi:phosphatidylglycerophosphate synthase
MLKKENFRIIYEKVGNFFSRFQIPPNYFTLASIFFAIFYFFSLVRNNLILAILFFILASVLDFIDGAVAKFSQKQTELGSYLDSVCDRYVESIFIGAFLFLNLPKIYLDSKIWAFLALFGSFMTTFAYAKAIAGKERETFGEGFKKSLLDRPERLIIIFISLILGLYNFSWMIYPIIFLAIFSNISAFQRIFYILKLNSTKNN